MKYSTDDGQTWNDYYISALDSMPLGSIILYAGDSTDVPAGWMLCDGTSLSEEEYPALYDILGYKYGGSGTSFNLPNFKGRVPVGLDTTQTEFDNLGETGGEKTHTLTVDEMPSHNHGLYTNTAPGETSTNWGVPTTLQGDIVYANTGRMTHTGGSQAHNNLQPYLVVNYIIKVEQLPPILGDVLNSKSDSTVDTYSCDYINNVNTYSTTEINTGKTWIDGKPIYRKTLYLEASTTTQNILITSVANNINQIWIDVSNSYYSQGGIVSDWETTGRYRITIDAGAIYYVCSNNSYKDGYITFNYTKSS